MLQRHRNRYARLPGAPNSSPPRSKSWRRPLLFALLFIAALFPLLFITLYSGSMRLCLPVNLSKLSEQLHRAIACPAVPAISASPSASPSQSRPLSSPSSNIPAAFLALPSITTSSSRIASSASSLAASRLQSLTRPLTTAPTQTTTTNTAMTSSATTPGRLADWLLSQKEAFLADLPAKGKGWLVAMGNEAGDLDTLSSSIAYAYLASTLKAERVVPLILTPRKYMHLRPENFLALERAHIPPSDLLHLEDLPVSAAELLKTGVELVLVDHNRALPAFGGEETYAHVRAIVDHHEDEGVSLQASPRVIKVPNGSTTSLVTQVFREGWAASLSGPAGAAGSPVPPEVSTLLLSALVIDTQGLKAGGKATITDVEAAEFLYPLSSLDPAPAQVQAAGFTTGLIPTPLDNFSNALIDAKFDVTGMSEHDLLLRDYKEYPWDTSSTIYPRLVVGLCTVPVKLETVLAQEGGWANALRIADAYMAERGLDVVGIATTWKNSEGKGRRELLLSVRAGGALPTLEAANITMAALAKGLGEDVETFALEDWKFKDDKNAPQLSVLDTPTRISRVWRQGNHRSTRKQLAPAMHRIIAELK